MPFGRPSRTPNSHFCSTQRLTICRYRGSNMCKGRIAPGRRTTFNGKSEIRSGPMKPIADNTRPWREVACCHRQSRRRGKAAGLRGLRPALQVTQGNVEVCRHETPKGMSAAKGGVVSLCDLGEQAFHL